MLVVTKEAVAAVSRRCCSGSQVIPLLPVGTKPLQAQLVPAMLTKKYADAGEVPLACCAFGEAQEGKEQRSELLIRS